VEWARNQKWCVGSSNRYHHADEYSIVAFQTAVALAEYDAEKDEEGKILLNDTHLRSIVDMSRDFKKYLDDTHGADEDKRAAMESIRYDDRREN
jgi:F0F1-type ATP synthase delta subunit